MNEDSYELLVLTFEQSMLLIIESPSKRTSTSSVLPGRTAPFHSKTYEIF